MNLENQIEQLRQKSRENFVPIVRDKTLQKLLSLIKEKQPNRILEIGTATGYSAINMLRSCNGAIVTIEKNEQRAEEARQNIKDADFEERTTLICGDALVVLNDLSNNKEKFDFVFLDGPKGQYIRYFPLIKSMLVAGGIIFADNVGVLGLVNHSEKVTHKNRTMVRNMQAFLRALQEDIDFNTQIFDEDDGYAIAYRK